MTMTELVSQVEARTALYLPDYVYTSRADLDDVNFASIEDRELWKLPDSELVYSESVILRVKGDSPDDACNVVTSWSRHQILQAVGTKEKWFRAVDRRQEAAELNLRRSCMQPFRLRRTRTQEDHILVLRGIVSPSYADISDLDVVRSLSRVMPHGTALRQHTGLSDRAFYAYVFAKNDLWVSSPIGDRCFPGLIAKNSEVGFTSLQLIPFMFFPNFGRHGVSVVLERDAVLRQVHRGKTIELQALFDAAVKRVSTVWADVKTQTLY
jgi:hypothetical protein